MTAAALEAAAISKEPGEHQLKPLTRLIYAFVLITWQTRKIAREHIISWRYCTVIGVGACSLQDKISEISEISEV